MGKRKQRLIKLRDAMRELGVSRQTMYRIFRGRIIRIGRYAYIPYSEYLKEKQKRDVIII